MDTTPFSKKKITYEEAGVDVRRGYEAVSLIKDIASSTFRKGVVEGIGGFAALYEMDLESYRHPLLVSSADGVGTKLKIAFQLDRHDTVGIDCVAMCVNDLLCSGGEPLFFLDYIATGKINPDKIKKIVQGIALGCRQAGCSLIGGETAEMPDFYKDEEYDLAGFALGVVEKDEVLSPLKVEEGDQILGLASSGLHSNGFSLVRQLFTEKELKADFYRKPFLEELLTPTRIYVPNLLPLIKSQKVRSIAHITGGGFIENIPRALPPSLAALIGKDSWPVLPIFHLIQERSGLSFEEMASTFNMGIGMTLFVKRDLLQEVIDQLQDQGEKVYLIGEVKKREEASLCFV